MQLSGIIEGMLQGMTFQTMPTFRRAQKLDIDIGNMWRPVVI